MNQPAIFIQMCAYICKNENPWHKMVALDFCKEKLGPSMADIQRGIISKDKALEILEMGYRVGVIRPSFYRESSQKLKTL